MIALIVQLLRVHQWSKNMLLFVPAALAHTLLNSAVAVDVFIGAVCFSFMASAVYLINDVADRTHDLQHQRKRHRPIARGAVSTANALIVSTALSAIAITVSSIALPQLFTLLLLVYAITSSLYTFFLKKLALFDVLALAGLYTLRIVAGGAVANVEVSPWLLGFSMFMFLSLAFLKRYTELRVMPVQDSMVPGRGYQTGDAPFVLVVGVALGMIAVLVCTLYVDSDTVRTLYTRPHILWLIGPTVLLWLSHAWLVAFRGNMHDDPIVFAMRDRTSWFVGLVLVTIVFAASWH